MLGAEHQGDRLRRLRVVAGRLMKKDGTLFTQGEMAAILGVKQQTYSMYENAGRQPDAEVLAVFRDQFDVTSDWLLLGDDDNMPHYLLTEIYAVTDDELRAAVKKRD
jgi:transcriptional regulator with XRE-family HTH domain